MRKVARFAHKHRHTTPRYEWALPSRCPEEQQHRQSTPLSERRLAGAPKNISIDDRPRSCPRLTLNGVSTNTWKTKRLKVTALLSVAGGLGKVTFALLALSQNGTKVTNPHPSIPNTFTQ